MKLRSWLSTCSSTADDATVPPPLPPKQLVFSDSSSGGSSASHDTTISSYGSNLSIQTLPSVPSLQKLSPEALSLSVTHRLVAAVTPRPGVQISSLAVHQNLLYAAAGKEINVFDIENGFGLVDTFNSDDSSTGSTKSVAFCDGKVLTAHQNSKIRVWEMKSETKSHKIVGSLPTKADLLTRFVFPANYVSVRRHRRSLWISHQDAVAGLSVSGGNFVCSVSWDKHLKIWGEKRRRFRCLQSIKAHDDAINAVVSSADGTIYTASADRRIKVWGRPYGEWKHALVATLEKHKSAVNALALSVDGTVLFSGACDRSILVWEREDSANHMVVVGALRGHSKAILCLINVSDLLLSGSADRTVRIWTRGGEGRYCCLGVLDGHETPVKSLAAVVAGDELKVFSGSFDGEIKVWNVTVSRQNSCLL